LRPSPTGRRPTVKKQEVAAKDRLDLEVALGDGAAVRLTALD